MQQFHPGCLAAALALSAATLIPATIACPAAPDHAAGPAPALTHAVIREFMGNLSTGHAGVRAAELRARAAATNVLGVRTWEDPTLGLAGAISGPNGFQPSEDGNLIAGLEQKLPLFGKAGAARSLARAEAGIATARSGEQLQNARRDLVRSLHQLALTESLLAIGRVDLGTMGAMLASAESQFAAGQGGVTEILRLQNELAARTNELRRDQAARDIARLSVNRLLHLPLDTPIPEFQTATPAAPVALTAELADLALAHEPALEVLRQEIRAAEASADITRRSQYPDIHGLAETRLYSGSGTIKETTVGVSVTLPWLNRSKNRADRDRDRHRLEAAELDLAALQQRVREEVHRLVLVAEAARREALLYQDEILPRAETALASALSAWGSRKGLFVDVMDARRQVLAARVAVVRAATEQHQTLADLARWCGSEDVDDLNRRLAGRDPGRHRMNQPGIPQP